MWRAVLVITLCLILLTAPAVWAGEWVDDHYVTNETYPEGRGKTLALATLFGVGTGFICSGIILIFYTNPDADRNFDAVMYITVPIFTFAGVALGMLLPPGAANENSAASLRVDDGVDVSWNFPQITAAVNRTLAGATERLWHANLVQLSF